MKFNFYQNQKNILKRTLIQKKEGTRSYLQWVGFAFILSGILYFILAIYPLFKLDNYPTPGGIAAAFFTTMLGVSLVFPDVLKGQTKEFSTLRILIFLFANVLCMLLLKIGWDKKSFAEIGLDGYCLGAIALVIGAIAAQLYFEHRKFKQQTSLSAKEIQLSNIAIAQLAKVQNEEKLHAQFPSIEFASDTIKDGESCLTLYLKDDNAKGIPDFVTIQINETTIVKVQTEIVTNIGDGKPHLAQLSNNIADSDTPQFIGSMCCLVESTLNSNVKGVLTSGHLFTDGKFMDFDGFVNSNQATDTLSNGASIGELYFQQMIPNQDLAIVKLNEATSMDADFMKFPDGFYHVSHDDLNAPTKNVTILSKGENQRDAFIVDTNVSMRLYYVETQKIMRNIILLGSDTDKNKSTTMSVGGDSGSCVYHKESKKMIGMLLGGNDKFSFVLPFEQTLNDNNFKLI